MSGAGAGGGLARDGGFRFDPVATLAEAGVLPGAVAVRGAQVVVDEPSGLSVIAGDVLVAQACADPVTFAGLPVPGWGVAELPGVTQPAGGLPLDRRARAVLRLVWPAGSGSAARRWGAAIAAHLAPIVGQLPGRLQGPGPGVAAVAGQVADAVTATVLGISAAAIAAVRTRSQQAVPVFADVIGRAVLPTVLLYDTIARSMANPTTEVLPAGCVLEDLLTYAVPAGGLEVEEVAALGAALAAAVWDATFALSAHLLQTRFGTPPTDRAAGRATSTHPARDRAGRDRLVDDVAAGMPAVVGWLRVTTQTVLLHDTRIPAGATCLLTTATTTAPVPGRWAATPLAVLRWLAPADPGGAGMTVARLAGHRLLAALTRHTPPAATSGAPGVPASRRSRPLEALPHW